MSRRKKSRASWRWSGGRAAVRKIRKTGKSMGWGPYPKSTGPSHMMREPVARDGFRQRQAGTMFSACGPFWPCVTSKLTFWPS